MSYKMGPILVINEVTTPTKWPYKWLGSFFPPLFHPTVVTCDGSTRPAPQPVWGSQVDSFSEAPSPETFWTKYHAGRRCGRFSYPVVE